MLPFPTDIFTEPDVSPNDLANLGPLRRLAGIWQADKGVDINPKAQGPERRVFREHIRMDPIDPQTNGPSSSTVCAITSTSTRLRKRLPFTIRSATGFGSLHDDSTGPGRARNRLREAGRQDNLRHGEARRCAVWHLLYRILGRGLPHDQLSLRHHLSDDGSWTYNIATELLVKGRDKPFDHHDTNTLKLVEAPTLNPLAAILNAGVKPHHVFQGNWRDAKTVPEVVRDLEQRFGLKRIVLVGDRGMATSQNIDQLKKGGHGYVVGRNRRRSGEVFDYIQSATGPWIECPVGISAGEKSTSPKTLVQEVTSNEPGVRVFVVHSDERLAYERAQRTKAQDRVRRRLEAQQQRVANGKLKAPEKIGAAAAILARNHGHRYYGWSCEDGVFRFFEHPVHFVRDASRSRPNASPPSCERSGSLPPSRQPRRSTTQPSCRDKPPGRHA
jgi:hypothetical protein